MESRTTTAVVEFHRPFRLSSRTGSLPAGRYRVDTEEEMLTGISFPAWRRTSMTIMRHDLGSGRLVQSLSITPAELAAALAADGRVPS